tara:strand:+ start:49 stop:1518 length:1470 start_codon:yes stop_codon:yes gene_type:complete
MAINYNPYTMNQAAIMNSLLGQQGFGASQQAPQFEEEEEDSFGESLLAGLASLGAALNKSKSSSASSSLPDVSKPQGGFFDPGGFGYENLGPRLGENIGQFFGEQLYGTGITAEGQPTGFPIDRPSAVGDIATLPGNALRALDFFAGPPVDAMPGLLDYFTGQSGVESQQQERENQEDIRNAVLDAQSTQELSRLMQQAESNSPQANFLNARAQGVLTPEQINEANAFAASMGTTFDPNLGYSRNPFLESQEFETPTINSILNLPAGVGNFGMKTDAQGRMISQGDDRSAFDQASRDRLARLEARDVRPGETLTERDTRIADSRTEGTDRGGEMSFEEARKFVPKGAREKTKDYNERIKAYQAQQNSSISQLKEEYEEYRVQGQVLNNERIQAYTAQYQQTEPEKYRETLQVAQEMLQDGLLQDETQAAMYVIEQMGGKVSDIFDPATQFMRDDDDVANVNQPNVTEEEYNKLKSGDSYFHNGQSYIKQ